jgi:hypothetical protein
MQLVSFNAGGAFHNGFDGVENFGAAAEVLEELDVMLVACLNMIAMAAEDLRAGVAKAEDGLVDIADGIEVAATAQEVEQPRLLAIGVLILVHQDLAKLALHALAHGCIFFEQTDGEVLEVGEIESAELLFFFGIRRIEAQQNLDQRGALAAI